MASSSRGRERREYRPTIRRSRSPIPTKRRSYTPPIKRKASPIAERELSRRPKVSKSPVGSRSGSRGAPELRYNSTVEPDPRPVRNVSTSDRFRAREYEDREVGAPQFRGPEGSVDYNINDLKKFTIEIVRKPSSTHGDSSINRSIINPDDIAPVRRPDMYERDCRYYNNGLQKGMRGGVEGQKFRGYYNNRGNFNVRGHYNNHHSQSQKWKNYQEEEEESYSYNAQNEGSRPLFRGAESSSSKDRPRTEEYQRIVAINNSRGSGHERGHSRERPPARYSPAPGPSHYEDSRRPYYSDRERERGHSPYEARHRSPHREEYVDKQRERRGGSREDVKREFIVRKKEERRYSPERRPSYERDQRESDLRSRINEKRSDPHPRIEERERERRYEGERERHGRPHHSSPPRERRRPASPDRHEGSRDRREVYEREKERDREGRERDGRRRHSRERESRDHSDNHYEESRRPPPSHKSDYEPKKFYKSYEPKEFLPPPVRGRGMPMRRGVPPIMRGRGIVRGMSRGFRGGVMVPRGIPRGGPFIPRGFPPRFFPPY